MTFLISPLPHVYNTIIDIKNIYQIVYRAYGAPAIASQISSSVPWQQSGVRVGDQSVGLLARWSDGALEADVAVKGKRIRERLSEIVGFHPKVNLRVRGRGMIQGLFDGPFLHFFFGAP